MTQVNKVYCVIPAWNEGKNIGKVLNGVVDKVYMVVVVNDGSSDDTSEIARKSGAVVLDHITNRGQGASLATGNEFALKDGADVIVHFDADGQFLTEEIADVCDPILLGECDIVFGSRFLGKRSEMPWFKEKVIMPIAAIVMRVLMKARITDPQSGFRALSRAAAEEIKISNDAMAHCSEILVKAYSGKWRVKEVPVTVLYPDFGQRFSAGFIILKDLLISKFVD